MVRLYLAPREMCVTGARGRDATVQKKERKENPPTAGSRSRMEGVRKQVWKQGVRTFGVWNRVRKGR